MSHLEFSIYIHIPFCRERCHYCDFLTAALPSGGVDDKFVDLLCKEIYLWRSELAYKNVETIYFGGGTPSLCTPKQIDKILNAISQNFTMQKDTEITLEANPLDLDLIRCKGFIDYGVTRLSIGGQSSKNETLIIMGRYHNHAQTLLAVKNARDTGFENISLDLIFGIPGQTLKELECDLNKFTSLETEHLSCYQLTISKNHPWKSTLPVDSKIIEFDSFIQKYLEKLGFNRYEVSNYAKFEKVSKHNSKYWSWKPYLGIGPGAHGFFPEVQPYGVRYRNVGSLRVYSNAINENIKPAHEPHKLSRDEGLFEFLMTHLRSTNGFKIDKIKRLFDQNIDKTLLLKLIDDGLVTCFDGIIGPTKKGLLVGEEIAWKLCKNNELTQLYNLDI